MSRKDEEEKTYTPGENDLRMEGMTDGGVRWSIYDTFCKNFCPSEKARADRELYQIYMWARQHEQIEKKEEK